MNNIPIGLKVDIKPTDYRMGDGNINLEGMPLFPSGSSLLDFIFFEPQLLTYGDTNGCVIFTGQQIIDCLWEAQTQMGLISAKTIAWADSLGFMDIGTDGKKHFHSSEHYLQIRTGNGLNGNNITDVFDAARKYGIIPDSDFPIDSTMTPQQYVNPALITQAMTDKGIQFLAGVGGKNFLSYNWVNDGTANPTDRIKALPYGPLAIGVNVGNDWNTVTPPAPVLGASPGHCIALFVETLIKGTDEADIFDHYHPNPKKLINWDIRFALQAFLTIVPPPPAPVPPPLPSNTPTPAQISSWQAFLLSLTSWLNNLLGSKGRETSNQMNYSIFKSRTFWTSVLLFVFNGFTAISQSIPSAYSVPINFVLGALITYFHVQGVQNAAISSATLGVASSGQ